MCGPVAQWIRYLTTNQGIPGSNPGGVYYFWQFRVKKKMRSYITNIHIFLQRTFRAVQDPKLRGKLVRG